MYKPSLGHKRICPCGKITYYDLNKIKLDCPTCGKEIEVANLSKPRRGRKPGTSNALNIATVTTPETPQPSSEPAESTTEDLDIDNVDSTEVDGDNNIEDDSVLIQEDTEVDPAVDVGIRPEKNKEDI